MQPESSPLILPTYWSPGAALRRVFFLLRHWWWVFFLIVTVSAFSSALWWWNQPALFVSTARMAVGGRLSLPDHSSSSYTEELVNFFGTQVEFMLSSDVRRRAEERVRTLQPALSPAPFRLNVNQLPRTSIFILNATGSEPRYTQALLNAVTEEYINLKKEMRSATSETTGTAITREMTRVDREVRDGEQELLRFQKLNNVGSLQEEARSASEYLSSRKRQLADLETEFKLLDLLDVDQNLDRGAGDKEAQLQPQGPNPKGAALASTGAENEYLAAKQRLALLEARKAKFAQVLRPKHPDVLQINQEIAQQQTVVDTFKTQTVERIASRRDGLALQIGNLKQAIEAWEKTSLSLSERLGEYDRINASVERSKSVYDQLMKNLKSLDVGRNIDQEMVSILEKASPPETRKPALRSALNYCAIAIIALSAGALFLFHRLDDRATSLSEVELALNQNVLGQIPRRHSALKAIGIASDAREHAFIESFRALRSSICYLPKKGDVPRTILVTSSVPGEGKSTVASHLAAMMACNESRVLLIDCDLRRGRLHTLFGLENHIGLTDVLRKDATLADAVCPTEIQNLSLLPRGTAVTTPAELCLSTHMDRFFEEISGLYDCVIIDSAPVMVADDTTSLAPKIDATLFVVRCGVSSMRRCRESIAMLQVRQARILGLLCNAVPGMHQEYYGYAEYYGDTGKQRRRADDEILAVTQAAG